MKRLLITGLVVLLVVTGGTFGYTYTTATATIDVNVVESDFAEIIVAEEGPTAPTVFGRFTGTWPTGSLFTITPHPIYQGDLVIKVYLVNTGQLIRYYHHCNMALEFKDSAVSPINADEQGIFQVLNLQNAAVEFTWANDTGDSPYKVELTGGSFRLHHWKALLTGGSTTPQVWCEVTQR